MIEFHSFNGVQFQFDDSGLHLVDRVDLMRSEVIEAIEMARRAYEFQNGRSQYVYLMKGDPDMGYQERYKIGVSVDPQSRLRECYGAFEVLHQINLYDLAFKYEAALHAFFDEDQCLDTDSHEWFRLMIGDVVAIRKCENAQDLCRLMDIEREYLQAARRGRSFDPSVVVKAKYGVSDSSANRRNQKRDRRRDDSVRPLLNHNAILKRLKDRE